MARRWLCIALVATLCLASVGAMADPASAGTYMKWSPSNDGLWGSDVSCLLRVASGTLLAGTAHEGVFATTDNGQHWHWSGRGLPNIGTEAEPAYRGILDLQDVRNSPSIVYLASEMGAYVSQDGGGTWQALGGALATIRVSCIAADPGRGTYVLAGTDDGVYVSENAGATWTPYNDQMRRVHVTRLVFDSSTAGAVYACTTSGLYKSTDYGLSWVGLSSNLQGANVQCLEQDPRRPNILFAGTTLGIYRSYDAGSTWALLSPDTPAGSVLDISVDSFDVALVGAVTKKGVLVSMDGGEHWTQSYRAATAVACGIWSRLSASPEAVLGTSAGPLFVSGGTASLRVQEMGFLDVTAVAYDTNSATRYAVRGSSLYRSDGTSAWQAIETNLGNARVYGLAIDHNEPRLMYAATEYGILRSTDGGASWIQLAITPSDVRGRIQAVAIDPADGRYVYGGNDYGVYRSDKGFKEAWMNVGPANVGPVVGIAAYAGDRNLLYVLTAQRLWKTSDRCKTWAVVNDHVGSMNLTSLVVADDNPTLLYAGSQDGAWRSTDGGITWTPFGTELKGLLVNSIVPGFQGQVLAGTSSGFFTGRTGQDSAGPTIQLDTPVNGTKATALHVSVAGVAQDDQSGVAAVSVNGISVGVDPLTGRFSLEVVLHQGQNSILVKGEDVAGNTTNVSVEVTYQPQVTLELTVGLPTMKILPDRSVLLDSPPIIVGGRTLVAIRPVVEALGGEVAWSAPDRKVTIAQGSHTIELWIDKSAATVDGRGILIDTSSPSVAPKIVSGRTMLPLRFVAETLGAKVDWEAVTKKITIVYPAP